MFAKTLLSAALAAYSANAYCSHGEMGAHKEANYTCAENGTKVCNADQEQCYAGQVWNEEACMCFSMMQCKIQCPEGQALDPRLPCKCIAESDLEGLFTCDPNAPVDEDGIPITCPFKLAELAAAAEEANQGGFNMPDADPAPEQPSFDHEGIQFGGTSFDGSGFNPPANVRPPQF